MAIGFFIFYDIYNEVTDEMLAIEELNQTDSFVDVIEGSQDVTNQFDYVIFGIFIGLIVGVIITGWFIGGYPIFMFIYFIMIIISVVVSAILSYIWENISVASVFGSNVSSFPITNHLMTYLPMYAAIIGFIGIVVMFAKPYFSEGE